jgi:hypothetical protein
MESALNSCFKRLQEEVAKMEEPLTSKQASVLINVAKQRLLEFLEWIKRGGDRDLGSLAGGAFAHGPPQGEPGA